MKKINFNLFFLFLTLSIGIFSCSNEQENILSNLTSDYELDKNILYHFLEIDTTNCSFHLNLEPKAELLSVIPPGLLDDRINISTESILKFQEELDEINSSLKEKINDIDFIELNTNYERYLIKLKNTEINLSLVDNKIRDNDLVLRNDNSPMPISSFVFDTDNRGGSYGTMYAKDKLFTSTVLTHYGDGYVEVELSSTTGLTADKPMARVYIIRLANTEMISEHLHEWKHNENGVFLYWSFWAKFNGWPASDYSVGTVTGWENGVKPKEFEAEPTQEPYFSLRVRQSHPCSFMIYLVNGSGKEIMLGSELFGANIDSSYNNKYKSCLKKQIQAISAISDLEIRLAHLPFTREEIMNYNGSEQHILQDQYLLLNDIKGKVKRVTYGDTDQGYVIISKNSNKYGIFVTDKILSKDTKLKNHLNNLTQYQMNEIELINYCYDIIRLK